MILPSFVSLAFLRELEDRHLHRQILNGSNFTARRYASVVYTVVMCPSVRLPDRAMRRQKQTNSHSFT